VTQLYFDALKDKLDPVLGGILRLCVLMILDHRASADELYVDGVAVAHEMRGKGIGTHLFELLERTASENGARTISLEVIDTNTKKSIRRCGSCGNSDKGRHLSFIIRL
jgi:GNAT superfamily N-acetyltransferase